MDERRQGEDRREAGRGGRRKDDKVTCPYCGSGASTVRSYHMGPVKGAYPRVRKCDDCQGTYDTLEKVVRRRKVMQRTYKPVA
jgi:hypothetical protein